MVDMTNTGGEMLCCVCCDGGGVKVISRTVRTVNIVSKLPSTRSVGTSVGMQYAESQLTRLQQEPDVDLFCRQL